ncbi:PilZ domain-containing protein [Mucisphaera calidilacus]|uniref:PilZ domain protein n=1 Tax=Mucisphaera calidilacus TaxID=2527982 RepID=A0A518BU77_9BACT|nr:PilZ domain-containing protein [Mucisphaera calidilacus]QDU70511.1 PilZ domain protein [Mucisphaera calidilacus]
MHTTNQRQSQRTRPSARSSRCTVRGKGREVKAVITDFSDTGLGVRLQPEKALHVGDIIQVAARPRDLPTKARIVRIHTTAQDDPRQAIIGCSWASSNDRRQRRMHGRMRPCHA